MDESAQNIATLELGDLANMIVAEEAYKPVLERPDEIDRQFVTDQIIADLRARNVWPYNKG